MLTIVGIILLIVAFICLWYVSSFQTMRRLRDQGKLIISDMERQRPQDVPVRRWDAAVDTVNTTWGNVIIITRVESIKEVRVVVNNVNVIVQDQEVQPAEKLLKLLDCFAEVSSANKVYIENQKAQLHSILESS